MHVVVPDSPYAILFVGAAQVKGETMKTMDFKVVLEPDADGGYVVTCPTIPGCYSQGDTIEEALKNIREAIEVCIEDMEAHGEEVPNPSKTLVGSVVVTL